MSKIRIYNGHGRPTTRSFNWTPHKDVAWENWLYPSPGTDMLLQSLDGGWFYYVRADRDRIYMEWMDKFCDACRHWDGEQCHSFGLDVPAWCHNTAGPLDLDAEMRPYDDPRRD